MKIFFYTIILSWFSWGASFACCAESDYKLMPLGEYNKKLIYLEFDLSRNCKKGVGIGDENEFWISGIVDIVFEEDDNLITLLNLDTFSRRECICTSRNYFELTNYEMILEKYILKAHKCAEELKNFKMVKPIEILFNDTLNTRFIEIYEPDSYKRILYYKDLLTVDFDEQGITTSIPSRVAEVRSYETEHYQIKIVRIRTRFIEQERIAINQERFKNRKTAIWKSRFQWHGISNDIILPTIKL